MRIVILHLLIPSIVLISGCRRSAEADPTSVSPTSKPAASASTTALQDRFIRVLLLDEVESFKLSPSGVFDVIDPVKKKHLLRGGKMGELLVRFGDGGIELAQLGRKFDVLAVDLVPVDGAFKVAMPKGERIYKGRLRLLRGSAETGYLINIVDIEEYLLGVVPAEVPGSFHAQAQRAQAIAARTFAWYEKQTKGSMKNWDVLATEGSQMYIGMPKEGKAKEAEAAVQDTKGVVCTWNAPEGEQIFCTYFSATCGGSTQNAGPVKNLPTIKPLIGGVECAYCRSSPHYRWGPVRLEKWRITQRLCDRYPKFKTIGSIDTMEVIEQTPAGRPVRFLFRGDTGKSLDLEAENFRLSVDPSGREIRSTFFVPVDDLDGIILQDGRGFGHGIGLCQYGADGLARTGRRAGEILSFYYPSSQLTRAY